MSEPSGYWSQFGTAASVDWCEPNYAVVTWVAEWWNVVSSIPLVIVGFWALYRAYRADWHVEVRFRLCFAGLAVVGLGSVAFHGTLRHAAQALDELPMVYTSLVMAYCVIVRRLNIERDAGLLRRWQFGLLAYAVAFTAAYFLSPDYFVFFIVSFAGAVSYLVIQGWRIVYRLSSSRTSKRLYGTAAGGFVCAVFVFWIPERILPCDHALQAIHPHVWFHLLALVGTYTGFLTVLFDRLTVLDQTPTVTLRRLPWVSPEQ